MAIAPAMAPTPLKPSARPAADLAVEARLDAERATALRGLVLRLAALLDALAGVLDRFVQGFEAGDALVGLYDNFQYYWRHGYLLPLIVQRLLLRLHRIVERDQAHEQPIRVILVSCSNLRSVFTASQPSRCICQYTFQAKRSSGWSGSPGE